MVMDATSTLDPALAAAEVAVTAPAIVEVLVPTPAEAAVVVVVALVSLP